ncbi:hypothetical protein ABEB36_013029 [Hypothenemus hampei]|uniref:Guanylate kinase-like domain-containing protein n=1 Tax=Hypothenemus hampei TaxID=57062 RepID=A0ABD1E6K5_HYPHA
MENIFKINCLLRRDSTTITYVSDKTIKGLKVAQLCPRRIFIKPECIGSIIEMNKRMMEKQVKKTYEKLKTEQGFGKYFSAVIYGATPEDVYEQVKDIISEQTGPTI